MTKKRSDNSRLSLHPRIFSVFRVILQAVSRNAGHLAVEPPPNSAVRFRFQPQELKRTGPREKPQFVSGSRSAVLGHFGCNSGPRARGIQGSEKAEAQLKVLHGSVIDKSEN